MDVSQINKNRNVHDPAPIELFSLKKEAAVLFVITQMKLENIRISANKSDIARCVWHDSTYVEY